MRGRDLAGGAVTGTTAAAGCCAACSQHNAALDALQSVDASARCRAWSFDASTALCWLQSEPSKQARAPRSTSGTVRAGGGTTRAPLVTFAPTPLAPACHLLRNAAFGGPPLMAARVSHAHADGGLAQCCALCRARPLCQRWTLNRETATPPLVCFLRAAALPGFQKEPSRDESADSGRVASAPCTLRANYMRRGADLPPARDANSHADCCALCRAEAPLGACVAWSFDKISGLCWLQSSTATAEVASTQYDSGVVVDMSGGVPAEGGAAASAAAAGGGAQGSAAAAAAAAAAAGSGSGSGSGSGGGSGMGAGPTVVVALLGAALLVLLKRRATGSASTQRGFELGPVDRGGGGSERGGRVAASAAARDGGPIPYSDNDEAIGSGGSGSGRAAVGDDGLTPLQRAQKQYEDAQQRWNGGAEGEGTHPPAPPRVPRPPVEPPPREVVLAAARRTHDQKPLHAPDFLGAAFAPGPEHGANPSGSSGDQAFM